MYEFRRSDGRVNYPLCFIWYNTRGCDMTLNVMYGDTLADLTQLLGASRILNIEAPDECTSEWLHEEVNRTSGVKG